MGWLRAGGEGSGCGCIYYLTFYYRHLFFIAVIFFILIPPRQRRWGTVDAVLGWLRTGGRAVAGSSESARQTQRIRELSSANPREYLSESAKILTFAQFRALDCKVSLLDTGLAARLNHVTPAAMAPGSVSDAAGGLLESFVAAELRRQMVWADTPARLFHFRDRNGLEVDIVLESDDRRVAGVEMKAAGSVSTGDFKGLRFLRDKLKNRFSLGVVLHTGTEAVPFGDRLWALPYSALWT